MLMTIAKHKRLTDAMLDTEIQRNKALTKDIEALEYKLGVADRALTLANNMLASMKADYQRGKVHREKAESYNAMRRERNAAK